MKKIVECKLVIDSKTEGAANKVVIEGKGYYKKENEKIIIYFVNEDNKYKYEYELGGLTISFNDSFYNFKLNKKRKGIIKNGDLSLEITTFANKLEINENSIFLDYKLYQNDFEIGEYKTSLFF